MSTNAKELQAQQSYQKLQQEKMLKEQEEFDTLTYEIFEQNPKGKKWLDKMIESIIVNQAIANPDKSANHAFWCEGNANLLRMIKVTVKKVINKLSS